MKYTYFATIKSGKFQLRSNFWMNKKSTVCLSQVNPTWCTMSKPVGELYKFTWYWVDRDEKLQSHNHFLDIKDKLTDGRYWEPWFPIPDPVTGNYFINRDNFISHENFYQCADDVLAKDLITNPFVLLGYTNTLGSEKMIQKMQQKKPKLNPPEFIIKELRKRRNIVAYKENIEHLAYNFFASMDMLNNPIESVCDYINSTVRFQKYIPTVLDDYGIEYEMFSLDTGDYAKTFGLDEVLPRESSDTTFTREHPDTAKKVKYYMDKYHTIW